MDCCFSLSFLIFVFRCFVVVILDNFVRRWEMELRVVCFCSFVAIYTTAIEFSAVWAFELQTLMKTKKWISELGEDLLYFSAWLSCLWILREKSTTACRRKSGSHLGILLLPEPVQRYQAQAASPDVLCHQRMSVCVDFCPWFISKGWCQTPVLSIQVTKKVSCSSLLLDILLTVMQIQLFIDPKFNLNLSHWDRVKSWCWIIRINTCPVSLFFWLYSVSRTLEYAVLGTDKVILLFTNTIFFWAVFGISAIANQFEPECLQISNTGLLYKLTLCPSHIWLELLMLWRTTNWRACWSLWRGLNWICSRMKWSGFMSVSEDCRRTARSWVA